MQVQQRQTAFCYTSGPMFYLGQQIVRAMQDAGYPAKIHACYRSPSVQRRLKAEGRSKADAWQSPHQFYEAVDIIHPGKGWDVSSSYWDALAACSRVVSAKFGVPLELGHDWGWDSAHIEIKNWRVFRDLHLAVMRREGVERPPNGDELCERFKVVLPLVRRKLT
jgi:hypothetical protein